MRPGVDPRFCATCSLPGAAAKHAHELEGCLLPVALFDVTSAHEQAATGQQLAVLCPLVSSSVSSSVSPSVSCNQAAKLDAHFVLHWSARIAVCFGGHSQFSVVRKVALGTPRCVMHEVVIQLVDSLF